MKTQKLKFIYIGVFIIPLLTCITASPVFSWLNQMDSHEETVINGKKPKPTIPPWAKGNGRDKLEGDIKLTPNVEAIVAEGVKKKENQQHSLRGAVNDQIYLWKNGRVPYVIDAAFNSYPSDKQAIQGAINEIHRISCVRFIPRTSEQYYIRFIRGSGCWSYIGQVQISGGQSISIGSGCAHIGTVLHEIMHALGFFHTSSRHDRDSYVVVLPQNIISGLEHNFQKYTHAQIDRLEAPYDMTSLMHLPGKAFSKNGFNTIESRAGAHVTLGRTSNDLSEIDKAQLNYLYSCTNYPSCYKAFGMETGEISNSQITASSYKMYYEPHEGRLHRSASASGNGAWCAGQSYQQGEWLQVDLGEMKRVTGIATQGKVDLFMNAWTTHVDVLYSLDKNTWYKAFNGQVPANFDENSVQYNQAPVPFYARYVRFVPKHWYNEICLRVEIYGCDV